MTQRAWRDIGVLALAAIPLLLMAYTFSLDISDVRHTPVEVARVFRGLLFLGIASCLVAVVLSIRLWLASRRHLLVIVVVVLAVAFLVWALPLAWGVLGAIWIHGDV